jgi:hypothetical protein
MTRFKRKSWNVSADGTLLAMVKSDQNLLLGGDVYFINQEEVVPSAEGQPDGHIKALPCVVPYSGYRMVKVFLRNPADINRLSQLPHAPVCISDPETPALWTIWLHDKSGNLYQVYDITNKGSQKGEYPVRVSYRRLCDKTTWSRDLDQWHDSFTLVEVGL